MSSLRRVLSKALPSILLLTLVAACGDDGAGDPASTTTRSNLVQTRDSDPDALNILLVSFDTTRADALGCYGSELGATPVIDALAVDSVLFERAFSPVPITLPSHATMLTGLDPPRHRVRDNGVYTLPDEAHTLAELLGEHGHRTFAVVAAVVMMQDYRLDQGFDAYDQGALSSTDRARTERPAAEIVDATLRLLDGPGPFFGFVHFYDPHQPFTAPEPFAAPYADDPRNGYYGELRYADHELGRLLDGLRERNLLDRTLVVITSDHGEGRGEHGEITHGHHLHDATQHVPLLFRHPSLEPRRVTDHVVTLADLFPTLVEAAGLEVPAALDGRSLLPVLQGRDLEEAGAAYLETLSPLLSFNLAPLYGVRTLDWKYVVSRKERLYSLADDPGELQDVAAANPDVTASFRRRLEALRDGRGPALEENRRVITGEELAVLGGIGYVASTSTTDLTDPTRPDAYDNIDLKQRLDEGLAMMQADDLPGATAHFEALARELPDTFVVRQNLGACYGRQGQHEQALAEFLAAAALNPQSVDMQINVAMAAQNGGDSALAQQHLLTALGMTGCPPRAHFLLWESYQRDRKPEPARAALEALLERDDVPEAAKAEARKRLD